MKATINGVRYDTDTADWIGGAGTTVFSNNRVVDKYFEALYRTPRSGRYFLESKEKIIPLSGYEAKAWAVVHLKPEQVAAAFHPSTPK